MKKIFLYLAFTSLVVSSCRKDEILTIEEPSIETQNSYDDIAAQDFLQTHYLDSKGVLRDFVTTDTLHVKLADLVPEPVTLPSGVIYIVRQDAQPTPGTAIGQYDLLRFMNTTFTYVAAKTDEKVYYQGGSIFEDNINSSGVPTVDPVYYYVKKSVLDNAVNTIAKERSFYEIEGFQEALKKFNAFDIPDESNYNLQGVIIVPSRAAFARDPSAFNTTNFSYRNRSFVFNFQIYKATHFDSER